MKVLSFLTLTALLTISACSHHHKKSCCGDKEKMSCDKDKKCSDESCAKPKTTEKKDCKDDSCHKKS